MQTERRILNRTFLRISRAWLASITRVFDAEVYAYLTTLWKRDDYNIHTFTQWQAFFFFFRKRQWGNGRKSIQLAHGVFLTPSHAFLFHFPPSWAFGQKPTPELAEWFNSIMLMGTAHNTIAAYMLSKRFSWFPRLANTQKSSRARDQFFFIILVSRNRKTLALSTHIFLVSHVLAITFIALKQRREASAACEREKEWSLGFWSHFPFCGDKNFCETWSQKCLKTWIVSKEIHGCSL